MKGECKQKVQNAVQANPIWRRPGAGLHRLYGERAECEVREVRSVRYVSASSLSPNTHTEEGDVRQVSLVTSSLSPTQHAGRCGPLRAQNAYSQRGIPSSVRGKIEQVWFRARPPDLSAQSHSRLISDTVLTSLSLSYAGHKMCEIVGVNKTSSWQQTQDRCLPTRSLALCTQRSTRIRVTQF